MIFAHHHQPDSAKKQKGYLETLPLLASIPYPLLFSEVPGRLVIAQKSEQENFPQVHFNLENVVSSTY